MADSATSARSAVKSSRGRPRGRRGRDTMDLIELNKRASAWAAADRAARDALTVQARGGDTAAQGELVRRLGCRVFTREEISNIERRMSKAEGSDRISPQRAQSAQRATR